MSSFVQEQKEGLRSRGLVSKPISIVIVHKRNAGQEIFERGHSQSKDISLKFELRVRGGGSLLCARGS